MILCFLDVAKIKKYIIYLYYINILLLLTFELNPSYHITV